MGTVLCLGGENLSSRHAVLNQCGLNVAIATNERAAVAACRAGIIDAAVLDTHSPANFSRVASRLKRVRPDLPIVLVSDIDVSDAPESGDQFDRVIFRLDGPTVLLDAVGKLLSNVTATSSQAACSSRELRARTAGLRQRLREMRELCRKLRVQKHADGDGEKCR